MGSGVQSYQYVKTQREEFPSLMVSIWVSVASRCYDVHLKKISGLHPAPLGMVSFTLISVVDFPIESNVDP